MDPTLIILIALIVGIVLISLLLVRTVRRRRAEAADVLPPSELAPAVDYTSIIEEEKPTLAQRIAAAPMPLKVLAGVVALLLLLGCGLTYVFLSQPQAATTPTGPAPTITGATATVAGEAKVTVTADTTLSNGAIVTAQMFENGEPFAWFIPETGQGTVSGGQARVTLQRTGNAPQPQSDREYTVVLSGEGNGQTVTTDPIVVDVPNLYADSFYGVETVVAAPTANATPAPTTAPAPTAAPTTAPAPTAAPSAGPTLTATVFNGGRVRSDPVIPGNVEANVVETINANEQVTLLERTENGQWYRITSVRGVTGWVSASLLTVDEATAAQVPQQGQGAAPAATSAPATGLTATVFNGGRVRSAPVIPANVEANVVETINASEQVTLLAKTANGQWYRITSVRGVTGWVSASLLTVDDATAAQVPVE